MLLEKICGEPGINREIAGSVLPCSNPGRVCMPISSPGHAFAALGRHGPILLVLSLVSGTAIPSLASIAHAILPMSAFLLTLGSFLTAGLSPREDAVGVRL